MQNCESTNLAAARKTEIARKLRPSNSMMYTKGKYLVDMIDLTSNFFGGENVSYGLSLAIFRPLSFEIVTFP